MAIAIAGAIAVAIGAFMLNAAFEHNPQGVFVDQLTGAVDVPYSALLFLSWALPSFVLALLLVWPIQLIARVLRQVPRARAE